MDILDRLLGHDAWTTRELLRRSRGLTDDELDRDFDIGHRTLRRTFLHIIRNMEVWTDLISGQPVRPDDGGEADRRSIDGLLARLDVVASQFRQVARRLVIEGRLDELWIDHLDDPPQEKSYGGAITHLLTHSMHHRAQVLFLLRSLGVTDLPEGDVLSWERQLPACL
ncbi:DinB family protein [bacterium]|nr:DinB family protein [bacterium]